MARSHKGVWQQGAAADNQPHRPGCARDADPSGGLLSHRPPEGSEAVRRRDVRAGGTKRSDAGRLAWEVCTEIFENMLIPFG
ncbi:hypothetical protein [Acetobacter oeni]|uniref:hypothetical protein n=1 Tax=Acetobacter oeni TaxID=304077 RepID=UPI0011BF3461|nr:hypothetical protein [Acetobacter oeni]MBB3881950.1 hypothetical protein [Acetobacter oeni]NHO17728.1 hypothetical protein [Acetobacter oeni]